MLVETKSLRNSDSVFVVEDVIRTVRIFIVTLRYLVGVLFVIASVYKDMVYTGMMFEGKH